MKLEMVVAGNSETVVPLTPIVGVSDEPDVIDGVILHFRVRGDLTGTPNDPLFNLYLSPEDFDFLCLNRFGKRSVEVQDLIYEMKGRR